jgi:hypothetical protein
MDFAEANRCKKLMGEQGSNEKVNPIETKISMIELQFVQRIEVLLVNQLTDGVFENKTIRERQQLEGNHQ